MAIQFGTVDGLVNISTDTILCFTKGIEEFERQGGPAYASSEGISYGTAFQRFIEPVYTDKTKPYTLSSIKQPVHTRSGEEQSPARVTFCKKMGLLKVDEPSSIFSITPLGKAVLDNDITIKEYAFILLSKMGVFKDGVYIDNLLCVISSYFLSHAVISQENLGLFITEKYSDSKIVKTRLDIIINSLVETGLVTKTIKDTCVLSGLGQAEVFSNFYNHSLSINKAEIDTSDEYADYIGKMGEGGIFSILSTENADVYLKYFPGLKKYVKNKITPILNPAIPKTSADRIQDSYRPFITAIKSKPFLLLAGISGTGKSRIVRELARACWDEGSEEYKAQKPKNFEMVQVKPNWHDSSELIGYVSRIDGVRYVVGPFLKFMVKAMQDPETPYFLCLDEMNLAPVEQYFAEYLSVVESRKKQDDGTITTDPIIEYSNTEEYKSLIDQLFPDDEELRIEYLTEGSEKRLRIPNNLIVVGTVNMDETTFSFSRKVLDRAMTIEMNEVDLTGGLDSRHEKIGKLGAAELIGNAVEGVDVYSAYKGVCDTAIAYLQKINDVLEGTPFKIAYRTRNEVLLYVVNNLPYNNVEGDEDSEKFVVARALDEITNMKILSRIEGDESKVSQDFLNSLKDAIHEGLEAVFSDIFDEDDDEDEYISVSLSKLDEMKKRLESGYTSFWS